MSATSFNYVSSNYGFGLNIISISNNINDINFSFVPVGQWGSRSEEVLNFNIYFKMAVPSSTLYTEDVTSASGWNNLDSATEVPYGTNNDLDISKSGLSISDITSETVLGHFVVRNQTTGNDALYIQLAPSSSLTGSAADKFLTTDSGGVYGVMVVFYSIGGPGIDKAWASRADANAGYDARVTFNNSSMSGALNTRLGISNPSTLSQHIGIMCLLKGTQILTPSGYVKIENLKENDIVLNSKKEEKKIKSMLYQKCIVDPEDNSKKNPKLKHKYLLRKDSIKENMPTEDLILSGGHMIKIGDEFHLPTNSDKLENIQKRKEIIEYYNIELDHYDFIIANGVEVESLAKPEVHKEKVEYYKERGIEYRDFIKPKN